ncbi:hypothetical protein [Agarilytica rhodophyticola]|uniref:hypothetical protein n=1 Tax=Agarilytica rhodophyticola TaxID=1737490 RepID=UPI000B344074|nr:hypothetical protein [Agarilytica rhodophyticola]
MSRGAGGTDGGIGQFFIGLVMLCGGVYMLLQAITVTSSFGMGARIYSFTAFNTSMGLTTGMVMVPFIFGVGMIFYNSRNFLGWLLTIGALSGLLFGVISSIHFHMRSMSAFELITILILSFGGLGLFLRSLRDSSRKSSEDII